MGGTETLRAEIVAMVVSDSERPEDASCEPDEHFSNFTGRFSEHYLALSDEYEFGANDIAASCQAPRQLEAATLRLLQRQTVPPRW